MGSRSEGISNWDAYHKIRLTGPGFGTARDVLGFHDAELTPTVGIRVGITQDASILRGAIIFSPLLAALPLALGTSRADAAKIDPSETSVTLPDAIHWSGWLGGFPPHSAEMAMLYGGLDKPGPYLVLMKWYPGYMSAPHTYATDRLSLVLSGTWWVNSGSDFDPDNTVPVPAGSFVKRAARTPHYDGVKVGAKEPALIGIFGIAPVAMELAEADKPAWRKV